MDKSINKEKIEELHTEWKREYIKLDAVYTTYKKALKEIEERIEDIGDDNYLLVRDEILQIIDAVKQN